MPTLKSRLNIRLKSISNYTEIHIKIQIKLASIKLSYISPDNHKILKNIKTKENENCVYLSEPRATLATAALRH